MKPFWLMEMEDHKSKKIMLHHNVHYIIHCSACAVIVSVQFSLACCVVLTVHSFHTSTLLRYKYMWNFGAHFLNS